MNRPAPRSQQSPAHPPWSRRRAAESRAQSPRAEPVRPPWKNMCVGVGAHEEPPVPSGCRKTWLCSSSAARPERLTGLLSGSSAVRPERLTVLLSRSLGAAAQGEGCQRAPRPRREGGAEGRAARPGAPAARLPPGGAWPPARGPEGPAGGAREAHADGPSAPSSGACGCCGGALPTAFVSAPALGALWPILAVFRGVAAEEGAELASQRAVCAARRPH